MASWRCKVYQWYPNVYKEIHFLLCVSLIYLAEI
jgi:hypothetical protein